MPSADIIGLASVLALAGIGIFFLTRTILNAL